MGLRTSKKSLKPTAANNEAKEIRGFNGTTNTENKKRGSVERRRRKKRRSLEKC